MKKPDLKTCPMCGSTDIEWILPHFSSWECMECGYSGTIAVKK